MSMKAVLFVDGEEIGMQRLIPLVLGMNSMRDHLTEAHFRIQIERASFVEHVSPMYSQLSREDSGPNGFLYDEFGELEYPPIDEMMKRPDLFLAVIKCLDAGMLDFWPTLGVGATRCADSYWLSDIKSVRCEAESVFIEGICSAYTTPPPKRSGAARRLLRNLAAFLIRLARP